MYITYFLQHIVSFLNVILVVIKKTQQTNNRLYNHLNRLLLIISGWNTGFANGETPSSAMLLEGLILGLLLSGALTCNMGKRAV